MKKVFILALALCFALPLLAQEKEDMKMEAKEEAMAKEDGDKMMPPKAIDDEFLLSFVGEWTGTSNGPHGESEEWESVELDLNGQFLLSRGKSSAGEMMVYEGMGAMTQTEDGGYAGFWIDNYRGMYEGKGSRDGNSSTMTWSGVHGTYKETITKVSDDKYTTTWSFTDLEGKVVEGTKEMMRKKSDKMMSDEKKS